MIPKAGNKASTDDHYYPGEDKLDGCPSVRRGRSVNFPEDHGVVWGRQNQQHFIARKEAQVEKALRRLASISDDLEPSPLERKQEFVPDFAADPNKLQQFFYWPQDIKSESQAEWREWFECWAFNLLCVCSFTFDLELVQLILSERDDDTFYKKSKWLVQKMTKRIRRGLGNSFLVPCFGSERLLRSQAERTLNLMVKRIVSG